MFLSVGTGTAPGRSLMGNLASLAERLRDIVTDTEQTNRDFRSEHRPLIRKGGFYRFNVDDGSMAEIGLEEHQEAAKIATNTNHYLEDPRVEQDIDECIEKLCEGGQRLGLLTHDGEIFDRVCTCYLRQTTEVLSMAESEKMKVKISNFCENCLERKYTTANAMLSCLLLLALRFFELYFFCRGCSARYCSSCQAGHLTTHGSRIVRFTDVSWSSTMQGIKTQSNCSRCMRDTKCRLECMDCLACLCHSCTDSVSQRNKWLEEHTKIFWLHKSFRLILPPSWARNPLVNRECCCLEVHDVVSHCLKCSEGAQTRFL